VGTLKEMAGGEFARRVGAAVQEQDKRYAFFLGAGCSVSSGIPAAGALVRDHWLPKLKGFCSPGTRGDDWIGRKITDYDADDPAASYGDVMEALFTNPEERQREIERLCDGRFPTFGYAVLAQLMALEGGAFNVALTTNFDDLLADAMYLYTSARPLVIQHEALAAFIRPTRTRPLVVKLHGDNRLTPMNTGTETEQLKSQFAQEVPALLNDRGLIVLGYGGNDKGIAGLLASLPQRALPLGVYWVSGSEPGGVIREWLEARGAIWVRERDFDETMLLLRDALDLAHPDDDRFADVFARYRDAYAGLSSRIITAEEESGPDDRDAVALKTAVDRADAAAPGVWQAGFNAQRAIARGDLDEAGRVYAQALEEWPDNAMLLGDYASFVGFKRDEPANAAPIFTKALRIDPNNATNLGNYALFLEGHLGDQLAAETMYRRAIDADPDDANNLCNYAGLLSTYRRDFATARQLYERALAVEPDHVNALGGYAWLLDQTGEDPDKAQAMYERAIAAGPKRASPLSAYAGFLQNVRRDTGAAAVLHERAVAAEPDHADALSNYAGFLYARGDVEGATAVGARALELARPRHHSTVPIEVRFYQWANGPAGEANVRLAELKGLLAQGFRSPGWRFGDNIERMAEERPDDVAWAKKLADVVTGDAEPEVLAGWDAWRAA
jgi:Tfp pilus assembly protein PilF